jgi:outer membrane lipoprotein-sorting protein
MGLKIECLDFRRAVQLVYAIVMKFLYVLLLLISGPIFAEKISLDELSTYMNSIITVESTFNQINENGSFSTGKIYLKRPGKIRLEYDPPNLGLVIVGGGQVAIFDPKSDKEPFRFPLRHTPLSIILEENVNFKKRNMVLEHTSDGPTTVLSLQDPARAEYGYIKLVFTNHPVTLRQWVIDNNSGNKSIVMIEDWTEGKKVRDVLFNIEAEIRNPSR